MKSVIDASATLYLLSTEDAHDAFERLRPIAPSLMWSEATSVINERRWRGELDSAIASALLDALLGAAIERHEAVDLYRSATDVAHRLGWAKVYDAQYVAMAEAPDLPLVTIDHRLRRGASRLVTVLTPDEALA